MALQEGLAATVLKQLMAPPEPKHMKIDLSINLLSFGEIFKTI